MRALVLIFMLGLMQPCAAQVRTSGFPEPRIIGPWTISAEVANGYFWGCSMRRTVGQITMGFDRLHDGLYIDLHSPFWKLQSGHRYPVDLDFGAEATGAHATAKDGQSVIINLPEAIATELPDRNALKLRTANLEISIQLEEGKEALGSLAECYAKTQSLWSNPFGPGSVALSGRQGAKGRVGNAKKKRKN
jgi:hypothetical protein